jgi:hypothetical protein
MKKQIVTITRVGDDQVSYITEAGKDTTVGNIAPLFPGVKVGQKWEVAVDYGGQYPTGKVIGASLLGACTCTRPGYQRSNPAICRNCNKPHNK